MSEIILFFLNAALRLASNFFEDFSETFQIAWQLFGEEPLLSLSFKYYKE